MFCGLSVIGINTDIWLFSYLQPQRDVLACMMELEKKQKTEEICKWK